jgi:group II intron reverse transcriptase/maturase
MSVSTTQQRIAKVARERPEACFTALNHYLDMDWMKEAYHRLRRKSAPGVDGLDVDGYGKNLEGNLQDLIDRIKSGRYVAPPVRRVHIPKGDGKETRPIGMPTVEDKLVQRAVVMLLEPIYEQDFLDCSHGFRPHRSAHQALESLWKQSMDNRVEWVLDVDIKSFFDTLDHAKLREIIGHRVKDGVIRRLIGKWLKAGVMEHGQLHEVDEGTPQGGVISPMLSNIFLHEVLDKWFEETVKPRLRGRAFLIRYADDFVIGFEREDDARRVLEVLPKRFGKYGLNLHPTKTRLVPFGSSRKGAGGGGPSGESTSFDFLGFTHYWGKSRQGRVVIKRKTAHKRLSRSLKSMGQWMRKHLHWPIRGQWDKLKQKLTGHYGYYGITGNAGCLEQYYDAVKRLWHKWLNRRSRQRGSMSWERFGVLLREHFPLPRPRVVHSIYSAKA